MKLHLPLKLRAALLALCLTCAPSAFSFDDTIFKFEDSLASETGSYTLASETGSPTRNLHSVTGTVPDGTTAVYEDSGVVAGASFGANYKLTSELKEAITFTPSFHVRLGDNYWSGAEGGAPTIYPGTSFTLLTYVNLSSVSGQAAFFGTGDASGEGFLFGVKDGKLKVTTKGKADYVLTSMTALSADRWYALAVSYNADGGTNGKGLASFYVDGNLVGSLEIDKGFNQHLGTGSAIGSGSKDNPQDRWNGAMAELQILSGALTAEQVREASHLANMVVWTNAAASSEWNGENWYVPGASTRTTFAAGEWAIFGDATADTIQISEDINAGGMSVTGDYTYTAADGKTLSLCAVEISDDSSVTFGAAASTTGTFTITGSVYAAGDQGTGKLKVAGDTVNVDGTIHTALEVTGGTLTAGFISGNTEISGGSVTLTGGKNAFTGSDLLVSGGKLEIQFTNSTKASCIAASSNVSITGDGTLKLSGHDMLGWGDVSPAAINLEGEDVEGSNVDKIAKLDIVETDSTKAMTLKSVIRMSGYSEMKGSAVNTLGTSFEASGVNNTISNDILVRELLTIDVDAAGELTIASKLSDHADGAHNITKLGEGKVIFSNTGSTWTENLAVQEGIVQLKGGAKLGSGEIALAKGTTLEFSGTGDLTNVVTGSGKLSVLAGADYKVKSNMTLGATIENAGKFTLDGENGGKLTFTAKDDLTRGTDVEYRDPTPNPQTGNGYAEGTFIIIKNVGGASADGIDEIYIKGETDPYTDIVVAENGVKIVGDRAMKGHYYVRNSSTFKYGEKNLDDTDANAAAWDTTTGVVLNDNKLIMLTDLNKIAADQDGIILVQDPTDAEA
ncbi:MAG: LamG-like jellyroll fold domain-containing protein, partial [Akkermansia sp.]